MRSLTPLLFLGLLLAACTTAAPAADPTPVVNVAPTAGATGVPATAEPTTVTEVPAPTDVPVQNLEPAVEAEVTLVVEPTEAPATVMAESAGTAITSGRTADGAFFLGAPEAPITLIDYSDFL